MGLSQGRAGWLAMGCLMLPTWAAASPPTSVFPTRNDELLSSWQPTQSGLMLGYAGPKIGEDGTIYDFGSVNTRVMSMTGFIVVDRRGYRLGPFNNTPVPGAPGRVFQRLDGIPRLFPNGDMVFTESAARGGPPQSIWRQPRSGHPVFITGVGQQVPGAPAGTVFTSVVPGALPDGVMYVDGTFAGPSGPSGGGYFAFPNDGQAPYSVALLGASIANQPGWTLNTFGNSGSRRVVGNARGDLCFVGRIQRVGSQPDYATAPLVVRNGQLQTAENTIAPGAVSHFASCIDADGRVFSSRFIGSQLIRDGMATPAYAGLPILGLRSGESIGTFYELGLFPDLRVILSGTVIGTNVVPESNTVVLVQEDGHLRVILREGEFLPDGSSVQVPEVTTSNNILCVTNRNGQVAFVLGGVAYGTDLAGRVHVLFKQGDAVATPMGMSILSQSLGDQGAGSLPRAGASLAGAFAGISGPLNDSGVFVVRAELSSGRAVVRLQIPNSTLGACCSGSVCSLTLQGDCLSPSVKFGGPGAACNMAGDARTPCCKADFNQSGATEVQDLFAFLAAWFAGDARANFNGGGLSAQAIYDYLAAWLAGC
jgi:hypothetical protein